VLAEGSGNRPRYQGVVDALSHPDTMMRLFGKPEVNGKRRMAVTLARGETIDGARKKARDSASKLRVEL
jgi:phosphoribosylglycinamide formyltransferase 2